MQTYENEPVDIVNEQDCVIGTLDRSEVVKNSAILSRIVLAFIKNKEGKIAILRRTADKLYSPSCLAIVGGGVRSGETYHQAIIREIFEEAHLEFSEEQLVLKGYLSPHEGWQSSCFKKIFEVQIDQQILQYNTLDFCELYWLSPHEVIQRSSSDKLANGMEWLIRKYYL